MQWFGSWEKDLKDEDLWTDRAKYIDLSQLPCAYAFGISDCWPCFRLPDLKHTLKMTLELLIDGRTMVMVSSRSWLARKGLLMHSLKPSDLSCEWWREDESQEEKDSAAPNKTILSGS